jgi:hypothetical protein
MLGEPRRRHFAAGGGRSGIGKGHRAWDLEARVVELLVELEKWQIALDELQAL